MAKIGLHYHGDDEKRGVALHEASLHKSYRQLVNGLLIFAAYYVAEHDTVSKDPKWYRATDEADARKHVAAIRDALSSSETPEYALWTDRCARVYTLLMREYDGVRAFGVALLRATPVEAARRFPSLIAESRAAPTPRAKTPAGTNEPVPPPAPVAKKKRKTRKRRG